MKFSEEFRNALEDLNDYLQKRRPHLPASRVNNICKIVQKEWFKVYILMLCVFFMFLR